MITHGLAIPVLVILAVPWWNPRTITWPLHDLTSQRALFRKWIASKWCIFDLVQGVTFGILAWFFIEPSGAKTNTIAITVGCNALGLVLHTRRYVVARGWYLCNPIGWSTGVLFGLLLLSSGWWVPSLAIGLSLGAQTVCFTGPLTIIAGIGSIYAHPHNPVSPVLALPASLSIGLNWCLYISRKPFFVATC